MARLFNDDERRISSVDLARMLGIPHEQVVREIEEHREELERHGPIVTVVHTAPPEEE